MAILAACAAACVYSPKGQCDTAGDCAAGEICSGGVCRPPQASGGGIVGIDPTPAMSVTVQWAKLAGGADATASVDAVGADPASGDVVVAGAVGSPLDLPPDLVGTGAFVARRAGADGSALWATSFPTFAHGRVGAAFLAGGDVLFAGTAFDPTVILTAHTPPARGTLFVGVLAAADGQPVWRRAVDGTHATASLVPVAVAARGTDLVVAGTGSGDLGCGDTGEASFAAVVGADGGCRWSRGLRTRTISDVAVRDDGSVVVAGVCTPSGASFDPSPTTTCTSGMFVAVLSGADGTPLWARVSSGAGTVAAVRDVAVAPDGSVAVVGDAAGVVDLGSGPVDFGTAAASFAATFGPTGTPRSTIRPLEAPYAANPDALALSRAAYDRAGKLWLSGRYAGQPALGGVRFTPCRPDACGAAAFLARLEANGALSSFLAVRASPEPYPDGAAYVDDLALFVTTGTVAQALRFSGTASVGAATWSSAGAGLGIVRTAP